jgi:hypothetical protein
MFSVLPKVTAPGANCQVQPVPKVTAPGANCQVQPVPKVTAPGANCQVQPVPKVTAPGANCQVQFPYLSGPRLESRCWLGWSESCRASLL